MGLLELVDVKYIRATARLIGIPGKEVRTFKALSAGKTIISLEYIRTWQKNIKPAKEKTFAVTVKESPKVEKQSE